MSDQSIDDFTLLPLDDLGSTPDEDLAAAAASALEQFPEPAEPVPPVPFGRTPLFDFDKGRFRRHGDPIVTTGEIDLYPGDDVYPGEDLYPGSTPGLVVLASSPAMVTGKDALRQWCLMAVHSARYAHGVFTSNFGMELPDSLIGEATDISGKMADWGERLRRALTVHERIVAVSEYEATWVEEQNVVVISFTVVTDEDEQLSFGPLDVNPFELLES